ncbi:MAG: glycerol-3-phosphate 1-O-acyltransferase PlsY [Bdellovibrionota bacterium]
MATALPIAIIAFLLGSIPTGYLVGKLHGVDIRTQGSGNTGATNAVRVLGKKAGLITLFCDVFKGVVAVWLGYLFPNTVGPLSEHDFAAALGVIALFGHCYSPFLNFKGGKGVATGCGVFWVVAPFQTSIAMAIFGMVLKATRYVSLSSICAAISIPLLLFFSQESANNRIVAILASITAALIVLRHKDNIKRLSAGKEPKFKK